MYAKSLFIFLFLGSLLTSCTGAKPVGRPDQDAKTPEVNLTKTPLPLTTTPSPPVIITLSVDSKYDTDLQEYAGRWLTYKNQEYGITFDYPAIYEIEPYVNNCSLRETQGSPDSSLLNITVGQRIWIDIKDAKGKTFEESFGEELERLMSRDDISLTTESDAEPGEIMIGAQGEKRVTIEYRFGSLNRYGVETLIGNEDYLIEVNFTAGAWCDVPEIDLFEFQAAAKVLDTFQFVDFEDNR